MFYVTFFASSWLVAASLQAFCHPWPNLCPHSCPNSKIFTIFLSSPQFIYSWSPSSFFPLFVHSPLVCFWQHCARILSSVLLFCILFIFVFFSVSPSPPSMPYLSLWFVESQELTPTGGAVSPGFTAVIGISRSFIFKVITLSSFL